MGPSDEILRHNKWGRSPYCTWQESVKLAALPLAAVPVGIKWRGCGSIYWPHSCIHRQSYKVISWHASCDSQAPAQCSNFLDALFPMCDVPLKHRYLFIWQLQCQWQGKRISGCSFAKRSWKWESQSPCWVLNLQLSVLHQEVYGLPPFEDPQNDFMYLGHVHQRIIFYPSTSSDKPAFLTDQQGNGKTLQPVRQQWYFCFSHLIWHLFFRDFVQKSTPAPPLNLFWLQVEHLTCISVCFLW